MSFTFTGHSSQTVSATAGAIGGLGAARPKRRPQIFGFRWTLLLCASDLSMFLFAAFAAVELVSGGRYRLSADSGIFLSTIAYATFWLVLFERLGLYRRSYALLIKDELYYTTAALVLGALPLFLLFTLVPSVSSSRFVLLLSLVFATITVGGSRALLYEVRKRLMERFPARIAVVGEQHRLDAVLQSLNFSGGTRVLTLAEPDVENTLGPVNLTSDADLESVAWLRQARAWGADTILLTEILPPNVLPHLLEVTARDRISLAFAPPRLCAHAYDYTLRTDGHQALIVPFRLSACRPSVRVVKRIFDLVVASLILLIAAPVMLCAALAILIDSGGPILFRQKRVGLNGRVFEIFKFRTMSNDAEKRTGAVWVQRDDPRRTRIGTFLRSKSIDELPQLFNVLRGEMSLVGPRPERPVFVEDFRKRLPRYDERHLVRPGITGWSHIHMNRIVDPSEISERLSYDLFYIENWSLFMDVCVIVKTAFEVLFHRAA